MLFQATQALEAVAAQNKELSDQIQTVTKSLEEKCRVAACQADHTLLSQKVGFLLDLKTA